MESDVYGFGIVLFQILMDGRGDNPLDITDLEPLKFIEAEMDQQLKGQFPSATVLEMAQLAHLCLQQDYRLRPSMELLVQKLDGIERNLK